MNALESVDAFRLAVHIRCEIHLRNNIAAKLAEWGLSPSEINFILSQIFGSEKEEKDGVILRIPGELF